MAIQDVLARQLEMDHLVLKKLAERGDVPSARHAIEHHFISSDRDALVQLRLYAAALGFDAQEIREGTPESPGSAPYWYVDLVSRIPLIDGHISREAALMKFLAIAYRVEYDGWGTLVQHGVA
jgi:regulator of RNase E activity RraB